jgi:hypothetical protein
MAADYVVKDMNRFDSAGKNVDGVDVAPPVKRLAALKTYEDQPIPGAMFKKTEEDSVPQPKIAKPEPPRPIGTWTSDEEDALWNLVKMYSFNWPLVAETINATRLGNGNIARTEWCCFNKYIELRAKQFTPHSKGDYLFSSSQTNKKEKKVKVLGMLSTFNYISNLAKKRENARPPGILNSCSKIKQTSQLNIP